MKRRYKPGDWFVAPLPSGRAVTGIIARAAASRLFGYIFAGVVPREKLAALQPRDAMWRGLFNARAIEDHRWRIAATSLRFDPAHWPLPRFGIREPFGRRWSQRVLHDATLATLATHPGDESETAQLPDARIYEPEHLERFLDAALDSDGARSVPLVIVDVHAPLSLARLQFTPAHARVQSGEILGTRDTSTLAAFLNERDDVSLRFYGSADRATLLELAWLAPQIRTLELDIPLDTLALLYPLERLESLAIRSAVCAEIPQPDRFRSLRTLTLRGTLAHERLLAELPGLRRLQLQSARWTSLTPLRDTEGLMYLDIADMPVRDITAAATLPSLRSLALRRCDLQTLDSLRGLPLEALTIDGLSQVRDLEVLRELPCLRSFTIRAMPHLNVHHLRVLAECTSLQTLSVDLGSRSKNREVYRGLKLREVGL